MGCYIRVLVSDLVQTCSNGVNEVTAETMDNVMAVLVNLEWTEFSPGWTTVCPAWASHGGGCGHSDCGDGGVGGDGGPGGSNGHGVGHGRCGGHSGGGNFY